jgi:uncharacterized protein YjiS (DUF1127 family)
MSADVRTNILDDLLDAERHFRQQAENALRELQSVLIEQARRMAGTQMEELRRLDPGAPESWRAEHWRQFFESLPLSGENNGWNHNLLAELEKLKSENQALHQKMASFSTSLVAEHLNHSPVMEAAFTPVDPQAASLALTDSSLACQELGAQEILMPEKVFFHASLLGELRRLSLPTSLPVRFQSHFSTVGLNESGRDRQVRRKLFVLYLLGRGLDIRLEMDHLISQVEGIGSRSGALRRLYDGMVDKNLASRQVMEMSSPNTSLAMLQLTEDGRQLCQTLGWQAGESERQRIERLHQGQQSPQHTLAILIFAMHARLRGYRVEVLPELEELKTRAVPDVAVSRDQAGQISARFYVEVELSHKELDAKWRNLAQLQGQVALCARNAQARARLVGDCKLKDLHGVATDLESLIACKVPEISGSTPLWIEKW